VFNSKRPFNGFLTVFTYWLAVNSDYLDNSLAPKGPVFIYPVIFYYVNTKSLSLLSIISAAQ
jgi:hypothetical protein